MQRDNWAYAVDHKKAKWDRVLSDTLQTLPEQFKTIFRDEALTGRYKELFGWAGFSGMLGSKDEGADASPYNMKQGFNTKLTYKEWAGYTAVPKMMREDDQQGIIDAIPRAFAQSLNHRRNYEAWKIFNDGFTANNTAYQTGTDYTYGSDGAYLFSTSHILYDGTTSQANKPSTDVDLDTSALQSAILAFREQLNDNGIPRLISPKWLIVPGELEWLTRELLESTLNPENMENAINTIRGGRFPLQPLVVDYYLTDADAWFLTADKGDQELIWAQRWGLYTDADIPLRSQNWEYYAGEAFGVGYAHWHGLYGSAGA
jgi:phage major head subunit gpT-like protein